MWGSSLEVWGFVRMETHACTNPSPVHELPHHLIARMLKKNGTVDTKHLHDFTIPANHDSQGVRCLGSHRMFRIQCY